MSVNDYESFRLLISITFHLKLFLMHGLHVELQVNSYLQDHLSNYQTGYDSGRIINLQN